MQTAQTSGSELLADGASHTFSGDGGTFEGSSPEVHPALAAEPVEKRAVPPVPHSGPLPIPQTPPARHPRAAAPLPGQQLPGRA